MGKKTLTKERKWWGIFKRQINYKKRKYTTNIFKNNINKRKGKSKQKLFKYAGWGNEKTVRARKGWNIVNKQKDKTEELKRCATEISKKKK